MMFHKVSLLFYEIPMMIHELPKKSFEVSMWRFIGFPQSWFCLCLSVVVYKFPLVFNLHLLGFGCAQVPLVSVLPCLSCGCA